MIIGTAVNGHGLTVEYAKRPSRCAPWFCAGYDLTDDEANRLRETLHEDGLDTMITTEDGEAMS